MSRPPSPGTAPGRLRAAGSLLASGLALVCLVTAACGVPPELEKPESTVRTTPTPSGTASASPTPTPTPTPTSQPTPTPAPSALVPCAGNPSQAQVTAVLRRSANLPPNARVTFSTGPLCADGWQYSVVSVADREPLQAVTTGSGSGLRLVTAGSDVCSIRIRVEAPTPVRTMACEAASSPLGGL